MLDALGRFEESIPIYEEIVAQAESTLGQDHPWRLSFLNNLAAARRETGDLERAEADFRWLVQTSTTKLGPEHPETLGRIHNLGVVLQRRGSDDTEAERLLRRAFDGRRKVLEADHPRILQSRIALADLLIDAARLEEAERLLGEAPAAQEEELRETRERLGAARRLSP